MIFRSIYNKPVLLVGNGVRSAGASDLIYKFAEKTHIPVLTTMNGVDLVQDDLHIGFIGTHGNRVANMIINECDLVVAVGARLGIRQVGRDATMFAPKADLVRADIDEYELSRDVKKNEKNVQPFSFVAEAVHCKLKLYLDHEKKWMQLVVYFIKSF